MIVLAGCAGHKAASGPASAPQDHAPGHGHDEGHEPGHHHHDDGRPGAAHGGHMAHRFDDPEYWSKRFDAPERDAWQKPAEVVAALELEPGMTVADIGAGTGYFLPHLSRAVGAGGKVLALDVEPKLVEHMKKRAETTGLANTEARLIPYDDPKLPAGETDRVIIVDTWHHIAARAAYARKVFEGLRPGGALYVVDFTVDSPHGPPKKHRIPAEVVVTTLKTAGFEAEVIEETLPRQFIVRGRRPLSD